MYQQLQGLKYLTEQLPQGLLTVPTVCPDSPIFALVSTQPRAIASHCQAEGFLVRAVMSPTVPKGTERVRVCLHAGNTKHELDSFIECVRRWIEAQLSRDSASTTKSHGFGQEAVPKTRRLADGIIIAKL